CARLSWYFDVW
nr:immunoglobulin heavy chain junction region [Mus musculus]